MYEFVPYIISVWYAVTEFGIAGAAFVWAIRVLIDTIIILLLSRKVVIQLGMLPVIFIGKLLFAILILYIATMLDGNFIKSVVFVGGINN